MPWFYVCDTFYDHAKVLDLLDEHGPAPLGVWALAGAYCAKHRTDGVVSYKVLKRLGAEPAHVQALLDSGLWERASDGHVRFHDWGAMPHGNELQKAKWREQKRKQRARAKSGGNPANSDLSAKTVREDKTGLSAYPILSYPIQSYPSPREVRLDFERRFLEARAVPWAAGKYTAELEQLAGWLEAFGDGWQQALSQTLDGFFADEWAKNRGFPMGYLAKDPAKFHSPPKKPATPEEEESERNRRLNKQFEEQWGPDRSEL